MNNLSLTILTSLAISFIASVKVARCDDQDLSAPVRPKTAVEIANEGVDVEEHLDAILPLHSEFRDETGNWWKLAHFFKNGRPVILSLNYSDCPMMCSIQLTKLTGALRDSKLVAGSDYDLISVSINPNEHSIRARKTKEKYTFLHGGEEVKDNWHFLTGKKLEIEQLTTTVGFKYKYDKNTKEYYHPPVLIVCSSDGRVLRYIHGISFESEVLENVIAESAEGNSGESIGEFIFSCLLLRQYTGKNSKQIMQVMRLGGVATIVILAGILLPFWFGRSSKARRDGQAESETSKFQSSST